MIAIKQINENITAITDAHFDKLVIVFMG